jgi:hypothetical protein
MRVETAAEGPRMVKTVTGWSGALENSRDEGGKVPALAGLCLVRDLLYSAT